MWHCYRLFFVLLTPFLWIHVRLRKCKGREDRERFQERFGRTKKTRPDGTLLWTHAASVGEAFSALTLLEHLLIKTPVWESVLITTTTLSSAKLVQERLKMHPVLSKKCFHQFVPFDHPFWIKRFLNKWHPDLALFLESEIWPTLLFKLQNCNISVILVNARLSQKSFLRWKHVPKRTRDKLLQCFSAIFVQSAEDAALFEALGAKTVVPFGNLKYAASPLPVSEKTLRALQEKTSERFLWVAASTHPGEEEIILCAHKELKTYFPTLLTIIAPRHPQRATDILHLCQEQGMHATQHSLRASPEPWHDVYIADTFGELGVFYQLSDIIFIGGSFVPVGGHNLVEPAQLRCAIFHGPYMSNFKEMTALFHQHAAAVQVNNAAEIVSFVKDLLENPDRCTALQSAAKDLVASQCNALEVFDRVAKPYLKSLRIKAIPL
ncbi:MAG: 3-deoxy-D-manno-octulosonic acid transferase [Holosporales bacterium]|nr:3-deoxy-D-manno-octulosonic acid transferase [Holosporales bacterium]